jgi:hypothetical protein
MKKITIFLSAAIILTAFFTVTAFKTLPPGPSANGQGALDLGLTKIQHFSFHCSTDNNGNVTGSFEVKSASQEVRLHGNITCLKVFPNGKRAFMSGMITQRSGNGFPGSFNVGEYVVFNVVDNGEGANSAGDEFSDVGQFDPTTQDCDLFAFFTFKIANGNIQVKP